MSKRAICVGINRFANYPQFALNGCVNDAKDMAKMCKGLLGFKSDEVTVITDEQATKANLMAQLNTAVKDAKAGKIGYLLFSFSSHGTQMADKSGDEPDGMDEAFVPFDIAQKGEAWDSARIISDDELHDLFQQLPENVLLEVYLDTCHSGSGLRGAEFSLNAPRPRFIAPPSGELQGAVKQRKVRGFVIDRPPVTSKAKAGTKEVSSSQHHILWTGCKADQTSADAYFTGRYNGAFTYHFINVMTATNNQLSRKAVIQKVREALKGKFSQVPQLEGNATNRNSAILY
jgi:hypothetical protein